MTGRNLLDYADKRGRTVRPILVILCTCKECSE